MGAVASKYPKDIYTEPEDIDPDTLANLGPLRPLAGIWQGQRGLDINPKADGPERARFVDRIELQPIDPQANGPQLFYGLRYHQHIMKPGEASTYHDQIGYWLWEPATGAIYQTLAIPRGQIAMASGQARANAKRFELAAKRGTEMNGICSNPFLEHAFKTLEYRIKVRILSARSWSYDEDTVLKVRGRAALFHHRDRSVLIKIGAPTHPHLGSKRLIETAAGQHPIATILSCSDSRVPPEVLFDNGIGDIFAIRVAGNVVGVDEMGSAEYGVDHLGTSLMVVMGHTKCGVVNAVATHATVHGHIPALGF